MKQQDGTKSITAKKSRKKNPAGDLARIEKTALRTPMWIEKIKELENQKITPEAFKTSRSVIARMSIDDCAKFLHVTSATISRWEAGKAPIPFMAYAAIRLLNDAEHSPHSLKAWDGWKIIDSGQHAGFLYDGKCTGQLYTPADLRALMWVKGERDAWKRKAEHASQQLEKIEAANTRLRQLFNGNGVTKELRQMQSRVDSLIAEIATAVIINHPAQTAEEKAEIAA